ncbi:MAG: CAP domain-containing protein [Pedobacter sp.]|nr:CAP domain-containing protein [Pedobacter sp.]
MNSLPCLIRLVLPLLAGMLPLLAAAQTPDSKLLVDSHNHYRQELELPPLVWSDELAASAQAWAEQLAQTKKFRHSDTRHGENLWMGTAGAYSQKDMVDNWGSEKQFYVHETYLKVPPSGVVGHYTQIIWRNTSKVGCGLATFSGQEILVCHYDPPGNWIGQSPY